MSLTLSNKWYKGVFSFFLYWSEDFINQVEKKKPNEGVKEKIPSQIDM
jgi:hypothetical protein